MVGETLRARLAETNTAIEQAVVDGIIVEEKRSEQSAKVVAMHPEDILHFALRYTELDQVHKDLVTAHKNRLAELHEEWRELEKYLTGSRIEPARQEEIRVFMSAALIREDTRVIEECIARLREIFDIDSDAEEGWFIAHRGVTC